MLKKFFTILKKWWLEFARVLGWLNTRVLLTVVYVIIIGIPAIALKIFRKDLLDRKPGDRQSYWVDKEAATPSIEQAKRQF